MTDPRDPQDHIPLRPVEFEILLALTGGESHGYGIIKEASKRLPGNGRIETGTLYRALRRLASLGLVEPAERRASSDADDQRRRYFRITVFGKEVAGSEARRLADQVEVARARALLVEADGGGAG